MDRRLSIAVLWRPGRNVEWQNRYQGAELPDDAREEAVLHRDALREAGHAARLFRWRKDDLPGMLRELKSAKTDLVFNASSLAEVAFLEAAEIPYSGSGLDLVALDKATRKRLLNSCGIDTPPFMVVEDDASASGETVPLSVIRSAWEPEPPLSYPLFVKPVRGRGSSGITDQSIVEDRPALLCQVTAIITRLGQGALVENYVRGREVTVGIIGRPPVAMEPLEIEYNQARTNTYEHKMDNEILHCPARFRGEELERIKNTALRAFEALRARDFGRVDLLVDESGRPMVLELNTFAGLRMVAGRRKSLHTSYIGEMARAMGLGPAELLGTIVEAAWKRLHPPVPG